MRKGLAIILAAGEGTRMKSDMPKVLHQVAGRSLLAHVLAAVKEAGFARVAVVVGPDRDDVAAEARRHAEDAAIFVQTQRLGTAHAVLAAHEILAEPWDDVVVLFGDTPLVQAGTLSALRGAVGGHAVAALGFRAEDPTGYGRLIIENGQLTAIREHKDASPEEREIDFCNAGLMAFDGAHALAILGGIGTNNVQKEFYLTDSVGIARGMGLGVTALEADEEETLGINDRIQLSIAEAVMQDRLRDRAMRNGATLVAPETVFFAFDTILGRDVLVEPNVVFGPGVEVGDKAVIRAFSHLEGASVASGAQVGPYARLRPGARLGEKVRIGNFVEIKNAELGKGVKVNHLSYVGDATVGEGANIGAGTITCNYDGFTKATTAIGSHAFIGSNSALVAPVTIGAGAYIGSGSVITDDVPADALALGRGRQAVKEGWAATFRAEQAAKPSKKLDTA